MITHPAFAAEPWQIREEGLHLDVLPQSESVFALSNGHIGWRGNLDEGEPHGLPGSYLNGVYEQRPMPYAEAGYGYPDTGQAVINVTNGKIIRLLVDDEPFDLRYGTLHRHERVLDFRSGLLDRTVEWTSPNGRRIVVRSTRLVSLTRRAITSTSLEVQAVWGTHEHGPDDARSPLDHPRSSPPPARRTPRGGTFAGARLRGSF